MSLQKNYISEGLLVLRIWIGAMFLVHGVPKLLAGPELWGNLGMAMGNLGISFAPVFWGFMAAFAEAVGGLLIILGLFIRPAAALLFVTMFVAAVHHLAGGDGIKGAAHAIELAGVFLSLFIIGETKYTLQSYIFSGKSDNAGR
ncbi:MAG: DoxX family protein [Fibrobacterota bacterium]